MPWFSRLTPAATPNTTAPAGPTSTPSSPASATTASSLASSPTSPERSPLAPAFERSKAAFGGQIKAAMQESASLASDFKACLMEVGLANVKGTVTFHGYGTHKPMTLSLKKALPDDRLDVTVCLNVSGHDFKDSQDRLLPDAKQRLEARAKDNRYVIQVTRPDGTIERMTGIEAKGALTTAQDISLRGMKPGTTVLEAWPEGSAGVGGYVEGRRLVITYAPPGAPVDTFGG
jgi:hypothetical protein